MKKEKVLYYSTTVENGVGVTHEGDPKHAIYSSGIDQIQKRANSYHKWVEKNYKKSYDGWGVMLPEIYAETSRVRDEFMSGKRSK